MVRKQLADAGFVFARADAWEFVALDGHFKGHADGVIIAGPPTPGLYLEFPMIWEHKALNNKNWGAVKRDGFAKAFPAHAAQVAIYQRCLNRKNSALYTRMNVDTCVEFHFPVPYDEALALRTIERANEVIEARRRDELCRASRTTRTISGARGAARIGKRAGKAVLPLRHELFARRCNRRSRIGDIIMLLGSDQDGDLPLPGRSRRQRRHERACFDGRRARPPDQARQCGDVGAVRRRARLQGVMVNAHAPEMPTRFAKQLCQTVRGALALRMPADMAMRLETRCARDSLEPLRRDLLLDIAANPDTEPGDVHKRIVRPLTTAKNNLRALHTLRLLVCDERHEWRGGRMFTVPYTA
jgi:hypothetical protein